MSGSGLTFTNGSARWVPELDAMRFAAVADGGTVEFLITADALAAMIGPDVELDTEGTIEAFHEFQYDITRIAERAWRGRRGETSIVLREADVEMH